MVKPRRTEVYAFTNAECVPDANKNFVMFAQRPIDGEIRKVVYQVGTWAQAGSLAIEVSGTGESILYMNNVLNASQIKYPLVYGVTNINGAGSPHAFFRPEVSNYEGIIKVWGSGTGPTGSVFGALNIYYG